MHRPRKAHMIPEKMTVIQNPDIVYTEEEMAVENGQCRICLEGHIEGNMLIAPCKCTGSVQFIHEECMRHWIEKNREKKISQIRCELCKQPITYSIILKRQCNSWEATKEKLCLNYKIFFFLLFLFLINCGVTIYLIVIFVHIMLQRNTSCHCIRLPTILEPKNRNLLKISHMLYENKIDSSIIVSHPLFYTIYYNELIEALKLLA